MSAPVVEPVPVDAADRPTGAVAVLLVAHDGERWLPGVLEGLLAQPAHGGTVAAVVGVDTGSTDGSAALLGPVTTDLLQVGREVGLARALALAVERLDLLDLPAGRPEWLWILHDDSRPADDALARLLAAARRRPDVDLLGPKLREWPSLRRLLELGVTVSATGRRETGLERGEYDQGQHDEEREVLALNTAGLLVRRDVFDRLGGLDPALPLLGADLDLGWRAAAAGHTSLVVPDAVVFHAEAAHRGLRPPVADDGRSGSRTGGRTGRTGARRHHEERRGALLTLLAHAPGRALPWTLLRLVLGTLLRAAGLMVVRAPGEALDEVTALGSVLAHPGALRRARRRRRELRTAPRERVRALLAPRWTPYRHGLDAVGDVVAAATLQAADVAERRRAATAASGPGQSGSGRRSRTAEEDPELEGLTDTGVVARYLTSPVALALTAVLVVGLVASRAAFGAVRGGALSPVPSSVGTWWGLYLDSWHALGAGTAVPAPPYVPVLAVLGSVVGTTAAVSLLLLLAVPVGLWGAYRLLRVVSRLVAPEGAPRWLLAAGATTWAVVPFTSGAWGEGRLGLVVVAALLPWLAHAGLGFAEPEADRRRRAGWRVGLVLTLVAAFAPLTWVVVVVVVAVLGVAALAVGRPGRVARSVWGPPVVALAVPLVLLSPWWVTALVRGAGAALLLDTGRLPVPAVGPLDLAAGRVGDLGAPVWVGLLVVALAVLALLPRATRVAVTVCWVVAAASALVALLASLPALDLAAGTSPAGLGGPVLVAHAALVVAAVLGGLGAVVVLRRRAQLDGSVSRSGAARRPVAVVLGLAALVVPAAGLVWAVVGQDDLTSRDDTAVPAYMVQEAAQAPARGVLVVRGDVESGLTYVVRRGEGVTLGQDEVVALSDTDPALDATVTDLLSRPTGGTVDRLGSLGVAYVLLAAPADSGVAASLDATAGLTQSGADPGTRAWAVDRGVDADALDGPGSPWRVALLVVAASTLLVVVVAALPTVRGTREARR